MYPFFGCYFIICKQILKIVELDIKVQIYFNEDKQLVHSETSVLVHNGMDKQNVLWNVNRCSTVISL